MKIGVTGTRKGATTLQLMTLAEWFTTHKEMTELHHGDCLGVDDQVNLMARANGLRTASHPPIITKHRAYSKSDCIFEVQEYHTRNRAIVELTDGLIVVPRTATERQRSGTWSTYRYAKLVKKPIWIVHIDGSLEYRNDGD